MLIIEVTNSRELVRQRIGRLGERLIGRVVDAEAQVEKALIQELETAFKEFGIEARIVSVQGLNSWVANSWSCPSRCVKNSMFVSASPESAHHQLRDLTHLRHLKLCTD